MPVLIDKKDLAVLHGASRDETRYNLCSMLIEKDGTLVATDGYMLLAATREREAEGLDADVIVSRDSVEGLKKAMPKHGSAVLSNEGPGLKVEAGSVTMHPELVDAKYPKWRMVRPSGEPVATVRLDARLLERAVKAAIDYSGTGRKEQVFLDIEVRDELAPVTFKYAREDGGELEAIVMPVRVK